ncbi:hypothetical protein WICMUC_000044 [Wickerhamomyces mucosus]|uniref:GYF domain-containing protein n=1 Tax=Wickerhamomyces mucosus TaxID=1378264 RepID=A0A9P8TJS3_9ASCO|nr:hypothetical protein WICMUC_000044 [Wickerhamomyces mucosus]
MRPKPSRNSSQEATTRLSSSTSQQGWSSVQQINNQPSHSLRNNLGFRSTSEFNGDSQSFQHQQHYHQPEQQFNGSTSSKISRVYSIDQLLQVWSSVQDKLQKEGHEEKYRSLNPIRELIKQVENDRQLQKQGQHQHKKYEGSGNAQVAELTEKLNEINNWAQAENTGLDFASILGNVTNNSIGSNSNIGLKGNSPFTSKPILEKDTSFQSINAFAQQPQFLSQPPQSQLLQPNEINWYYLDPNGNQQGPFTGDLMQSWYTQNYLAPTLNVFREDEFQFYTLQDFINLVNNDKTPFLVPLPNLKINSFSSTFNQFESHTPLYQSNSGFIQTHQPQPQLPQLQQTQQNWATHSGRSSPWATHQTLNEISNSEFRLGTQSPFLTGGTSFTTEPSTQITQSSIATQDDEIFDQINSQVLNDVLKEETVQEPQSISVSHSKEASDILKKQESSVSEFSNLVESQPIQIKESPKHVQEKKEIKKLNTEPKTEVESIKAKPQLAPWANTSKPTVPKLTLDQIQQLEAEENAKQLKIKAEKDKLVAAQLLANAEKSIREAEAAKVPSLPSISSWGKPQTKPAAQTKTLLDIQREEAEAEAKAAQASQGSDNFKSSTNVTPAKNSFASIATSSVPSQPAWTVVSSTRKPAAVRPSVPKITSQSQSKINPDVLRSVSATTVSQNNAASSSKVSPRQEFLTWCRTTMKLNKGINQNEVLQILLMLPIGLESSEIIADTIYSNSSTMDGRRFAQEFLKRRKTVEDQVNDGLSWNDALHFSVEDDTDDWDFQVVGKKNKRRN